MEMDKLFYEYHLCLLKNIYHPALIQKQKRNIDADTYEKNQQRNKATIK